MEFSKEIRGIIIGFVVFSILSILLHISTIPRFTASFTSIPIVFTAISVIIATATFYLTHIKGPDITLKVKRHIELEACPSMSFPALFINEGGKPGTLIHDSEWDFPSVSLPKYLKDFGSRAEIKFDTAESLIKLAPGESVTCKINVIFYHADDILKESEKFKKLNNLFEKHKVIEFMAEFFATTKEGIEGISKKFKLKTKHGKITKSK